MNIVGFAGYAAAGKDTAAAALEGHVRVSFADSVRKFTEAINPIVYCDAVGEHLHLDTVIHKFGWEHAKRQFPGVRALLQRVGTDAGRKLIDDNIWIDMALNKADDLPEKIVVTDVRFPNEVEAIRARGGKVIWISRPGYGPVNAHVSDNALSLTDCDYVIVNDGTIEQLWGKVKELVG